MIKAIVYANRHHGFELYEESFNFPMEHKAEIYSLCNRLAGFLEGGPTLALRYAPFRDLFLLQVIVRAPNGNEDQSRPHHQVVSFLMDAADADAMFSLPFTTVAGNAKHLAQTLLQEEKGAEHLPADLYDRLLSGGSAPRSKEPPAALMDALWYGSGICMSETLDTQLFFATDGPPEPALARLIDSLPPQARKWLRFHTGITTGGDAFGTVLHFTTTEGLSVLRQSNYAACPDRTNKYCYVMQDGSNDFPRDRVAQAASAQRRLASCEDRDLLPALIRTPHDLRFLLDAASDSSEDLTRAIIDLAGADFWIARNKEGRMTVTEISRYYSVAPKNKTIAALYQQVVPQKKATYTDRVRKPRSRKAKIDESVDSISKKKKRLPKIFRYFLPVLIPLVLLIAIFLALKSAVGFIPSESADGSVVFSFQHINSFLNDLWLLVLGGLLGSFITVLLRKK